MYQGRGKGQRGVNTYVPNFREPGQKYMVHPYSPSELSSCSRVPNFTWGEGGLNEKCRVDDKSNTFSLYPPSYRTRYGIYPGGFDTSGENNCRGNRSSWKKILTMLI
eukprot:sb/3477650/